MYCRKCGSPNDENAYKCVRCGEVLQGTTAGGVTGQPIPNYLVHAILVTILCCLPFGIVAIVYAAQVNSKAQAGDIPGALQASRNARTWSLWGLGTGLLSILLYLLFVLAVRH